MDVKFPKKIKCDSLCASLNLVYGVCDCGAKGYNEAIDACIKAYNEAKPAELPIKCVNCEKEDLFLTCNDCGAETKVKRFSTPSLVPLDEEKVKKLDLYELRKVISDYLFEYKLPEVFREAVTINLALNIREHFGVKVPTVEEIVNIMDRFFDRSPKGQDVFAKGYAPLKKTDIRNLATATVAYLGGKE